MLYDFCGHWTWWGGYPRPPVIEGYCAKFNTKENGRYQSTTFLLVQMIFNEFDFVAYYLDCIVTSRLALLLF